MNKYDFLVWLPFIIFVIAIVTDGIFNHGIEYLIGGLCYSIVFIILIFWIRHFFKKSYAFERKKLAGQK